MAYREWFFLAQPIPTDLTDTTTFPGQTLSIYLDGESRLPMKWSAKFPLPVVGTRVFVTMNGLGWAKVVGYWAAGEPTGSQWLGIMTRLEKPPVWLKKQRKRQSETWNELTPQWIRDGIGCETGTEFLLAKPRKARKPKTVALAVQSQSCCESGIGAPDGVCAKCEASNAELMDAVYGEAS